MKTGDRVKIKLTGEIVKVVDALAVQLFVVNDEGVHFFVFRNEVIPHAQLH